MAWNVEYTDEFGTWWSSLTEEEQISIAASVQLLEERGPALGHPHSSGINGSRHSHMRELRTQHGGRPFRTLYAFDPRRMAILLIGGDKTGDKRWYEVNVPKADRLYDEHLDELLREGNIDG
ncbi:MAG: addiction module toxin RelE [Burkholderiales bacterium PBB3]|nr:MAG: addiction module toxin RelE [Burkholderiales bacterium PBB3]